jgi:cyanophycinase-like exopeptidase
MPKYDRPVYLIGGGRGSRRKGPDPLLEMVFQGFGIKLPVVAYTGTASGDDKDFFGWISGSFKEAGAAKVNHAIIAPDDADLKKAMKILDSADIVFVSGGDVEAGMEILQQKKMLDFFNGLYKQGKPFFGISAGAIMLASQWVRWPDPDDDDSAELFSCLNYAPVIIDCHDEQGGWGELQSALRLEKKGTTGYGLSSGSGIMVTPDGKVKAMGGKVYQYIRRADKVEQMANLPVEE